VHGTFADTARRLPEIAALGFDVIYLPPIHPIGETHRKGKNNARTAEPGDVGSPWAIGSKDGGHTEIHPELGTLADFDALVKSAGDFGIEIALDFALQCSPDHPWVKSHPEWFFIRPDGTIRYAENPPKKYEDIYPINFWCEDRENLWKACRDAILFWVEHGVKIFRVDNPHTKPLSFWEWAIREVQTSHPEVIFLSESFTRPNRMRGLAKLGFTQSYTYFTWKNTAWELKEYLTELTQTEMAEYFRPNFFANTPDILHEYLQHGGRPAFRIRLVLAATLSPIYGIYSGYELCEGTAVRPGSEEYLDSEKYQIRVRDWNAPGNIKQDISKLNRLRRENPALHELANLSFLKSDYESIIAYRKSAPGNELVIVVNLDPFSMHETMIEMPLAELGIGVDEPYEVWDLLSGQRYNWQGARNYIKLDPNDRVAHVFRVTRRA
jgi:starch synthase (maltosyl-transferring)